jgi:ABC-2 type transport system permease protein
VAQKRTYLGIGMAIAMPLLFVMALQLQNGVPEDVPFGRFVRESGLAIPLVLLVFGSVWLFPLITSLVAGDIFASEDHNGTLKTILTRSLDRGQIFAGKALAAATYAVVARLVMGTVAVVAGSLTSGFDPLTTLSGETVQPGRGMVLIGASLLVYLIPLLAIASIGLLLSAATRNSAGSIVGTLMLALILQLLGILPGLESIRPYLLPTQFDAWQGLLRTPTDWDPVVRAAWVCSLYGLPALIAAYLVFLRRDVAGG